MEYLRTENLNFYYHDHHVLHDINVSFKRNHITALIGPSGSGKSTLLRCFNRIFELYAKLNIDGNIWLQDQNLLDRNVDINCLRSRIGMVFQKPTPFPMSIFENIAFALRLHEKLSKSEMIDRVEEALQKAAIWNEVKDKLHEAGTHLSGGQQQRLCIARTIAVRPDILLLDEPTSALDPISSASIEELISTLKKDYTILLVTHNLKQAKRISDETIFMSQGHIIEHNQTADFFAHPQHPETQQYIQKN